MGILHHTPLSYSESDIIVFFFFFFFFFFLYSLRNVDCGYSLETPWRGGSNVYPRSVIWANILKIYFFSDNFLGELS